MGHTYQVPIPEVLLVLQRSLYTNTQWKDIGLLWLVPWSGGICHVRKCVYGTLPPGSPLGHWKAVKSGFGPFHQSFDVEPFRQAEMCHKCI